MSSYLIGTEAYFKPSVYFIDDDSGIEGMATFVCIEESAYVFVAYLEINGELHYRKITLTPDPDEGSAIWDYSDTVPLTLETLPIYEGDVEVE